MVIPCLRTSYYVATVLTVYGIETRRVLVVLSMLFMLQQYLPFTVLKLLVCSTARAATLVATVLTVYGIET